jgi:hypothetical protein
MSVYNRNYMAGQNRYSGTRAPSFGVYEPHPDTVREVRAARYKMGAGAALMVLGVALPGRLWTTLGVGGGLGVWTLGMMDQLQAGVEEKIGKEGVHNALARCASQCLIAPITG